MRVPNAALLPGVFLALCLGAPTSAQTVDPTAFQPRNDAGLGSIKRSFNATQLTDVPEISCNNEPKACALTAAIWHKGRFWVFGREGWAAEIPESWCFEWTGDGTYVGRHDLPLPVDPDDESSAAGADSAPNTSPEVRDLATDETVGGDTVLLGSEEGVFVLRFNQAQRKWEMTDQIVTANSKAMSTTATIPNNPIRGEGLAVLRVLGTPENPALPGISPPINAEGEGYMAVAYDPNGNGGDGSLYVGCDYGQQGDGRGAPGAANFRSPSVGSLIARFDANGDTVVPWQEPDDADITSTHWREIDESISPILEIDLEGNILRTLVNNPATGLDVDDLDDDGDTMEPHPYLGEPQGGWWCAGGITIDPLTGNLWVGVDMRERILEVDVNTGVPTGITIPQPEIGFLPSRQGGLTGIPLGDPGTYSSFWDMIPFTNVAGDDFFTVVRMHQYPGLHGTTEAFLEGTVDTLPLSGQIFEPNTPPPIAYTSQSTLKIDFNSNGKGSAPALLMFDLNDDVNTDAATSLALGLLPELRVHSAFSTPADNGLAFQFPWSTGNTLSLDLSAVGFRVETGQQIRVQGVYFDPRSQYSPGLMVTNEIWFGGVGINTVLIETLGTNPENADTSQGFFRVHWLDGPDIVNVKFNLVDSESNAGDLNDAYWNTSVPNMADVFMLGSGAGPGCQGTYRNDSDAVTGLVYDPNVNTNPIASGLDSAICDYYFEQGLQTDSGFILTVNSYVQCCPWDSQTLEFNFTDFGLDGGAQASAPEIFEFDCDADAMNGSPGGFFQGMIVEITLSDGTVFKGELLPDPLDENRSFMAW